MDENTGNYILDIDNNNITWQPLSTWDTVVYYGSYAAMVGLPVFYIAVGIGAAAAVYYQKKLRGLMINIGLRNGIPVEKFLYGR